MFSCCIQAGAGSAIEPLEVKTADDYSLPTDSVPVPAETPVQVYEAPQLREDPTSVPMNTIPSVVSATVIPEAAAASIAISSFASSAAVSSLSLTMMDAGLQTYDISVVAKPLGITFLNQMPLMVKTVEQGGNADIAGIKPEWTFKKIDGMPVDGEKESMHYTAVMKSLKDSMEYLPDKFQTMNASDSVKEAAGGFPITFIVSPGYTKKVVFNKKPLGCFLTKDVPVKISRAPAGSHAADLGVKVGWVLKFIGNTDVEYMENAEICKIIKAASEKILA